MLFLSNEQQTLNFDLYMLVFFLCTRLTGPGLSGLVATEGQDYFPASSNHISRGYSSAGGGCIYGHADELPLGSLSAGGWRDGSAALWGHAVVTPENGT